MFNVKRRPTFRVVKPDSQGFSAEQAVELSGACGQVHDNLMARIQDAGDDNTVSWHLQQATSDVMRACSRGGLCVTYEMGVMAKCEAQQVVHHFQDLGYRTSGPYLHPYHRKLALDINWAETPTGAQHG